MLMSVVFTRRKVRSFKNSLIEDSVSVAEQLDQFLGPNFYSWMEMMFIIDMLFIGERDGHLCKCGKGIIQRKIGLWREAERGRILRINCTDYCHCLCDC